MRALAILTLAFFTTLLAGGCGDDSTDGSSGNSGTQPSSCSSPCTVGAICYQPAPDSNCGGAWYCWADSRWHCAPPDSGGPSDATVLFGSDAADAGDDGPLEGAVGPD